MNTYLSCTLNKFQFIDFSIIICVEGKPSSYEHKDISILKYNCPIRCLFDVT